MTRSSETVYVEGVTVVGETAEALVCDVAGVAFNVPRALCREGTEIRRVGDRGWLAIPASFAAEKRIKRFTV